MSLLCLLSAREEWNLRTPGISRRYANLEKVVIGFRIKYCGQGLAQFFSSSSSTLLTVATDPLALLLVG